ncbi:KRI1-like family C-terminal-domain-containing protein [Syncephalis pseudoplumigaleata]|uniref:KRI1-like family C-terminal-domain-containing protein n=1 Tax=Syncephalis pseudoplumigaleata TaxID=1712513 RepID=A0A4P9Z291_9FUNG|nr:KRI1-like family C-terminal-domain-containing protein [Syncephalis pseudoplumigaleata]|eukprot:RKP26594.1 KRI1-like family C-terminal-domain-containing protein [Syncephalis pseudoplumigaleata]
MLEEDSEESSSSDEEDETGELLTPAMDAQIMRTLLALRNKDPRVYDKDTNFYSAKVEGGAAEEEGERPVTLQDFQRKILLEEGGLVDEEKEMAGVLTHAQEQQQLKDELKAFAEGDGDNEDGELFTKRESAGNDGGSSNYQSFLIEAIKTGDSNKQTEDLLSSLADGGKDNSEDAFLLNYVLNRGWLDGNVGKQAAPALEDIDLVEDEQAVEAADHFESEYNFRFEEEGGVQLVHHARNVDDSMRRKDNSRKLERERRKERKAEEKLQKMEELKRLKNLKKQEILEKLRKIQEITGNNNVGIDDINLDEDFNPDNYDTTMSNLFSDSYYDEKKKKKKKKKEAKDVESSAADDDIQMDADYLPGGEKYTGEGKCGDESEKSSKKRKKLDEYLDEYYKLDYEDIVAGIPTRFKYRQVKPSTFGLSPVEILLADDADLNAHVSVKKLAP